MWLARNETSRGLEEVCRSTCAACGMRRVGSCYRRRPGITRDPRTSDPLGGQSGETGCTVPPPHGQQGLFFDHTSRAEAKNVSEGDGGETNPTRRQPSFSKASSLEPSRLVAPLPAARGLIVGTPFGVLEIVIHCRIVPFRRTEIVHAGQVMVLLVIWS